jgi:hypothetical protein
LATAAEASLAAGFFGVFWAAAIMGKASAAIKSVVRLDKFMRSSSLKKGSI